MVAFRSLLAASVLAITSLASPISKGNITYHNPILPGWHSDPSCTFVAELDNTYFCTTSSFLAFPGCPVYASKDLLHWKLASNAINREDQVPDLSTAHSGQMEGTWASTIRYRDGEFYLITAYISYEEWNPKFLLFRTTDPFDDTKWSDPLIIANPEKEIDPDIFWDDDGTTYLTISRGMFVMTLDTTTGAISEPVATWNGTGERNPEGPHLYKKDGYYYMLIAEGGTEVNHTVTIARSENIYGPYESDPNNPILTNKDSNEYFQTVGHADLFQDADDNWWGIALSTRSGPAWEIYPMGRETVLYPARWDEGQWPVLQPVRGEMEGPLPFGGQNKDVKGTGRWVDQGDDIDFQPGTALPSHFVHWRTPPHRSRDYVVSPQDHPSTLQLRASRANLTGDAAFTPGSEGQTFIARKQSHTLFSYSIDVSFAPTAPNQESGLTVFLTQQQHVDIGVVSLPTPSNRSQPHEYTADLALRFLVEASGKPNTTVTEPVTLDLPASWRDTPVRLKVSAKSDHEYEFSASSSSDPEDERTLGTASADILSGGSGPFTGTIMGAYATTNGGNQTFDSYVSRWRYVPVSQEIAEGQFVEPIQ